MAVLSTPPGRWKFSTTGSLIPSVNAGIDLNGNYLTDSTGTLTTAPIDINFAGRVGIGTSPSEKLEVAGAIKLGTTNNASPGTIRWTGTNFEGYNGSSWVSFSGGGGRNVTYVKSLDTNTSQVIVTNTTTATAIYTYTIPAGLMGTNKILRLVLSGTYFNNSNSNRKLTLNLVLGTTVIVSKQSANIGSSAGMGYWEAVFYLQNVGSTSSQQGSFRASVESGANTSVLFDDRGAGNVDTTKDVTLTVQAQHDAANANVTLTRDFAHLELLNANDNFGSLWTTTGSDIYYNNGNVGIGTTNPKSKLHVEGSVAKKLLTTTSTAFTLADAFYYAVDASSGTVTATLPAASEITGREYVIKKIDSSVNPVQISGTIDGSTSGTALSSQWAYIRVVSDGSKWLKVG